jgi:hypothetical protein
VKGDILMKTFWKWVLGIVIVLVVLAGLALAWHYLFPQFSFGYGMRAFPNHRGWGGRYFGRMPMMGGYGWMPFGFFGMWLFPLAVIALLVLGIIWLVKAVSRPKVPARVCSNCGRPAASDWSTCPYCGKKLE